MDEPCLFINNTTHILTAYASLLYNGVNIWRGYT